jgi:hypothetical protein
MADQVTDGARVGEVLAYAVGEGARDPWWPAVRFVAAVGVVDGAWYVLEAVQYFAWIVHNGSNLAVHLFYLSWRQTLQTAGHLGSGPFGAVLLYAAVRCMGR